MPLALTVLALAAALPTARAELVERPPSGAVRASLLLCDAGGCERDAAWVASLGIVDQEPLVLVDLLLELDAGGWAAGADQKLLLETSLAEATERAAAGDWKAVEPATERALAALEAWPGNVPPEQLFALYWLRGAAQLKRGEDKGHEASFRQAAAVIEDREPRFPVPDQAAERAFVEEQRKLRVAGTGTLLLGLVPPDTRIWVDGRPLGPDQVELRLPPGSHRVTALQQGGVRTWQAMVPVLGERTSRVVIDLPPSSSADWVTRELSQLFLTLQAPDELKAMLHDLCERYDLAQLRLLQVTQPDLEHIGGTIEIGDPSPLRPEAAQGEEVDHGDGVPSTYEAHVATEHAYRQARHAAEAERHLRVVYYDPVTGHLLADGGTAVGPGARKERLRLGATLGYAHMLEQHHAGGELQVMLRSGPLWTDLRVGAARAEQPYRLYPDWSDRWLYHVALGPHLRRAHGTLRPSVSVLGEAWVPVSLGGRAQAGLATCLDHGLCLGVDGWGALGTQGFGWGAGFGISQGL